MSMSVLSGLQCLAAFMAYLFMAVVLPSIVFGKKFKKLDLLERFFAYFIIGNFFMMNLVFALELLKISNKFTLYFTTIILCVLTYAYNNNISLKEKFLETSAVFNSVLTGSLGWKSAVFRLGRLFVKLLIKIIQKFKEVFIYNIVDWILIAAVSAFLVMLFGNNIITNFGYSASDLPVHNYWINYLSKNQIFVAGIYPFGFHCVIYYLHEIFGLDVYVLLRVFCFVQTYFIHIMILCVLKYCCKTKYTPYIGLFIYMALNIYARNTYSRYYSTLPQEFGMLFIYPCLYFAAAFFKERKKELQLEVVLFGNTKEQKAKKREEKLLRKEARKNGEKPKKKYFKLRVKECFSTWYLAGFAMSFAMTLAVHFYGTMIAGLLSVGIAAGFLFRFIRPKYMWRVLSTFMISIVIAVLPMAIAFAQGTPLQGSLGWGMNILSGKSEKDEDISNQQNNDYMLLVTGSAVDTATGDSVTYVSGASTQVSGASTQVSGASTQVSGASTQVSGASTQVSPSAVDNEDLNILTYDNVKAIVSGDSVYYVQDLYRNIEFERKYYIKEVDINTGGTLNMVSSGNQRFFMEKNLKYKRSIYFYVNLLKNDRGRLKEKLVYISNKTFNHILDCTNEYVFDKFSIDHIKLIYLASFILLCIGGIMFVFRQYDYGAVIISTVIFMYCMALLLASGRIGLITLMDSARASIYFAYMTPLIFAFAVDCIVFALFGVFSRFELTRHIPHVVAFACLGVVLFTANNNRQWVKEPHYVNGLEMNEAVTCLTNIISENEDFTWTICSANDETRMAEDHGYHYEIIEFLRKMEGMGGDVMLTIPTKTVYFFIEKIPLDYAKTYEGSGQEISEEGADNYLPGGGGLSVYQAKSRWIVMSRMYYWAKTFQKMYPNEMKVYMETDNFICYKIEQNTYRLYNFAIDYGYNVDRYKVDMQDSEWSND